MNLRLTRIPGAVLMTACTVAPLAAQDSILFTQSGDGNFVRDGGNGNLVVGTVDNESIHLVSPIPGVEYSAGVFLHQTAQYVFLGDTDGDADFVRSGGTGAWGTLDAVMVRRTNPFSTVGAHEVFHSFAAPSFDIGTRTVRDGDVLRFPDNFDVQLFLDEATMGVATGVADSDIDAICQDTNGNLYFSFADTETVNGVSRSDGALFFIDAADITYGPDGNITALAPASAQIVATESDVNAIVAAAGANDADATPITTVADLGALEIDPNGGTFVAPQNAALVLPNLLIGSSDSGRDAVIFSTANGGEIATINGVPMGSTVATVGFHLGLRSDSAGPDGLTGLALTTFQFQPLVVANSRSESSSLYFSCEVAGATPGGSVAILVGFADLGDRFSLTTLPGVFGGELFGIGAPLFSVATLTADEDGYAGLPFPVPPSAVGLGPTVWQGFDLAALQLGTPAIYQF